MGDAGEIAIPTSNDDQSLAQLLVSLGMGEFGSIDALLASDMTPEEMQSPLFGMGRAAAAAAGKRSRKWMRCVWVVLSVAAMVDGVYDRQQNSNCFIKAAPTKETLLEDQTTRGWVEW